MATTLTPIAAANTPFLSYPSFYVKCSKPININGVSDTKSLKARKNGVGGVRLNGFDKAKPINESNEIKKQETEARKTMEYINQLESEVARLQKQVSETEIGETEKNPTKEKLESVKAACISAIVGTLTSLPISLTHVTDTYDLTVSTAIIIVTCALYGATYRYIIRRDVDDFHLKTGASAAFGIVKGVATLDGQSSMDALSGAVCVYENVIIFLLVAAGLDICYKMGILSPFPLETITKM
ncbi:uncharacterized protein LOC143575132 [Bidens hawaiensis]|uniref:uncharacterized protein LOC143575132 n=1 Tax=Bidens hawaiensis TaxID=980011 RepID=UPI00404A83C0